MRCGLAFAAAMLPSIGAAQGLQGLPPFARETLGYGEVVEARPQRVLYERTFKGGFTIYRPNSGPAPFVLLATGDDDYLSVRLTNGLLQRGYAVVRWYPRGIVKDRTFREEAARLADGIQYLIENAGAQKLQPHMAFVSQYYYAGFSALIATDPSLLGGSFSALQAVVLLDPTMLDGRAQLAIATDHRRRSLQRYFGADAAAQLDGTAAGHVAAPNAPAVLLHVREDYRPELAEAEARFASTLEGAGVVVVRDVQPSREIAGEARRKQRVDATLDFVAARLGAP